MDNLTQRESEVVELLVSGYSNKEISNELFISIHTTKVHVSNIYKKYGVVNRVQAVSKVLAERMTNTPHG